MACGRVTKPNSGCSSEEVTWKASVISPTCAKSSRYASLRSGYIAGIIDEIRSLRRCAPLSARRIGSSGRCVATGEHGHGSTCRTTAAVVTSTSHGCITHLGPLHPRAEVASRHDSPMVKACFERRMIHRLPRAAERNTLPALIRCRPTRCNQQPQASVIGDQADINRPEDRSRIWERRPRSRQSGGGKRMQGGHGASSLKTPWRGEVRTNLPPRGRLAIFRRRAHRVG